MSNTFWEYSIGGDDFSEGEYESRAKAEEAADEEWAERVNEFEPAPRNGEEFEEVLELVEIEYDDNGEETVLQEIETVVYYEHYHGDYAEHFHQGDYI